MTAHKHASMIKAKADNMELVVFSKHQITGKWAKVNDQKCTDFGEEIEYFICHPKHTDLCLHWLNGGGVQGRKRGEWVGLSLPETIYWNVCTSFMDDEWEFRIKPRKETRWIGVAKNGESTMHYKNKKTLIENIERMGPMLDVYQLIEIEVEV